MVQMTVRSSLGKKAIQLEKLVGDRLQDKLVSLGHMLLLSRLSTPGSSSSLGHYGLLALVVVG